MGMQLEFFIF